MKSIYCLAKYILINNDDIGKKKKIQFYANFYIHYISKNK